jgi:hypothetical protein
MDRETLTELGFLVVLLALMFLFNTALQSTSHRDFKIIDEFHRFKTVGRRVYRGHVYHLGKQALTTTEERTALWRGGYWNQGFLPDNIYEKHTFRARQFDEQGFANPPGQSQYDIVCIGDSQTYGEWPAFVAEELKVSVGNFGTPALKIPFQFETYETFVRQKKPRVIIIGLFASAVAELAMGDMGYHSNRYPKIPRGALANQLHWSDRYGVPFASVDTTATRHGLVLLTRLRDTRNAVKRLRPWKAFDLTIKKKSKAQALVDIKVAGTSYPFICTAGRSSLYRKQWKASEMTRISQFLRRFQGACASDGAKLVAVFIPLKARGYLKLIRSQLSKEEQARLLGCGIEELPEFDKYKDSMTSELSKICQALAIPFCDLTQALSQAVQTGTHSWYITDSHLTMSGDAIVGKRVARFLTQKKLLSSSRSAVTVIKEWQNIDQSLTANEELSIQLQKSRGQSWLELDLFTADKRAGLFVHGESSQLFVPVIMYRQAQLHYIPLRPMNGGHAGQLTLRAKKKVRIKRWRIFNSSQ